MANPENPKSRWGEITKLLLVAIVVVLVGSFVLPSLVGVMVRMMFKIFGLLLVFLILAWFLSSKLRK